MLLPLSFAILLVGPIPAERQFDFWIGEWECSGRMNQGAGKWQETRGRNTIRKILKDKIVEENFEMPGFTGRSVSAYNATQKKWFQTWVDDGGAYIALTGGMRGKEMILSTAPVPQKPNAFSRMVFSQITEEGFRWRWEGTKDGGKSWTLQWELNYRRAKSLEESIIETTSSFGLPLV